MTTSTTSSSCHKGQHNSKETSKSSSNNKQQQQQPNFSKDEKSCSGSNASRINQTKVKGNDAATATRNTNFKCISGHFNDNDEIIVALLNAFQLQTKFNNDSNNSCSNIESNNVNMVSDGSSGFTCGRQYDETSGNSNQFPLSSTIHQAMKMPSFDHCCCCCCLKKQSLLIISPKLLLNKLRLCHYNKYWLVQNKYAEVISNLNYASLRSYYGNNYTNNNNNNSNLKTKNHNSYSNNISKCNRCCCCSSLATTCSSPSTAATSCHSYCCATTGGDGYGNSHLNGFVDDVDNTDFVCNLEVSIVISCLYCV